MTELERQVARILGESADYPEDKIVASTRVYHDAGLSGDDLYDFAVRLRDELGVSLPNKLTSYAPAEGIGLGLRDFFPWWFRYTELTVRELAALARPEYLAPSSMGRERL